MTESPSPTRYADLVRRQTPPEPPEFSSEKELDSLLTAIKEREGQDDDRKGGLKPDPVQTLRQLTINELIPIFVELVEKYSKSGISMQMDAGSVTESAENPDARHRA